MKTKAQQLKAQRAAAIKSAQDLIGKAQSAGRELTTDELAALDDFDNEIQTTTKSLDRMEQSDDLMRRLSGKGGPAFDPEEVAEQKTDLARAIQRKSPVQVQLPRKSFTAGALSLPGTGQDVVGATPGTAATALRDLFPVTQTTSPTVRWYEVGSLTGADVVAEGALKPELTGDVTPKDGALVKIAGRLVLTTEMMDDAEYVLEQIGRQALLGMVRRENELVLAKLAAAGGGAQVAAGTFDTALDTIAAAIGAQENVNGLTPERIIVNPADLASIRATKSTGSGAYVMDPLAGGPVSIYGVPVLSTPALASGTAYLARSEAGMFYERQAVTVTSMPSGDDFEHNRVTVVYEERVLPVVTQPGLLTKITLTAGA